MSIQSAVFATLGGYAGLSALVAGRIYPDVAPQGSLRPYVAWQEITLQPTMDFAGDVSTGGLDFYIIQVSIFSKTRDEAREIFAQVRNAMAAANLFKSVLRDMRALPFEDETKLYSIQGDFSVSLKT